MWSPNATRVKYEAIRQAGFATLSAAYAAVGTPFTNPIRSVKIVNTTNADIFVSYDGVTDQDIIPTGSFALYDYCSNLAMPAGRLEQPLGTQVWAREVSADATSGSVYVIAMYGSASNV